MSLCDKCFKPGWCCKKFDLSQAGEHKTFWLENAEQDAIEFLEEQNLPFTPDGIRTTNSDKDGTWVSFWYSCPKLGTDGRCTIYEDRPETCRSFEPASNELCVHYRGAESGYVDV